MSTRTRSTRARRAYEFISRNEGKHNVRMMCRLLGVAPSGYYAWLKEPKSNREREDERLLKLIRASFKASHGVYGAPRVFLDLREAGETCSKHRVAKIMRMNGMRALPGYRTRPRILMNSVQQSDSSRYGVLVQAGTVIHRLVGVG